ncbi:MAG: NUDIX hydrolase [Actinomycetota bacterium]
MDSTASPRLKMCRDAKIGAGRCRQECSVEQPRVHVSVVLSGPDGLLMVQEAKPDVHGRWNLPGGHVEKGEAVTAAGIREVHEETGLEAKPTSLVGVIVSAGAVRFVIRGEVVSGIETPGDDILTIRRFDLEELDAIDDHQLDAAPVLRAVFDRLKAGMSYPLEVFAEELV